MDYSLFRGELHVQQLIVLYLLIINAHASIHIWLFLTSPSPFEATVAYLAWVLLLEGVTVLALLYRHAGE
jgi:hypothetical protein